MKEKLIDFYDDFLYYIRNFTHEWFTYYFWKRRIKFFFQRRIRGFDDSETWDLDYSFMKWLLPRLKRFKDVSYGIHPGNMSYEQWEKQLNKAIENLTFILEEDEYEKGYFEKRKEFFEWFCENCGGLWW